MLFSVAHWRDASHFPRVDAMTRVVLGENTYCQAVRR